MLTTSDHSRDSAGLTYIYPVLSRRSGGLSIGINLNPNNACNWRCVYCQVPNLQRGRAPALDLELLGRELRGLLREAMSGELGRKFGVPESQQTLRDIAISGNGEPTSAAEFGNVVGVLGKIMQEFDLQGKIKLVLISNGSLAQQASVQAALAQWAAIGGEMWFKLDSATAAGIQRINNAALSPARLLRNLEAAARSCPVWLQTCLFAQDGMPPAEAECQAYLDFIAQALARGISVRGILLYGLARPSMQPEAPRLSALPAAWMEAFARRARALGVEARLSL
jgi:wyosine [tRNA(Phe)-imidazoG37] synthetase (radical SAM superfamily)